MDPPVDSAMEWSPNPNPNHPEVIQTTSAASNQSLEGPVTFSSLRRSGLPVDNTTFFPDDPGFGDLLAAAPTTIFTDEVKAELEQRSKPRFGEGPVATPIGKATTRNVQRGSHNNLDLTKRAYSQINPLDITKITGTTKNQTHHTNVHFNTFSTLGGSHKLQTRDDHSTHSGHILSSDRTGNHLSFPRTSQPRTFGTYRSKAPQPAEGEPRWRYHNYTGLEKILHGLPSPPRTTEQSLIKASTDSVYPEIGAGVALPQTTEVDPRSPLLRGVLTKSSFTPSAVKNTRNLFGSEPPQNGAANRPYHFGSHSIQPLSNNRRRNYETFAAGEIVDTQPVRNRSEHATNEPSFDELPGRFPADDSTMGMPNNIDVTQDDPLNIARETGIGFHGTNRPSSRPVFNIMDYENFAPKNFVPKPPHLSAFSSQLILPTPPRTQSPERQVPGSFPAGDTAPGSEQHSEQSSGSIAPVPSKRMPGEGVNNTSTMINFTVQSYRKLGRRIQRGSVVLGHYQQRLISRTHRVIEYTCRAAQQSSGGAKRRLVEFTAIVKHRVHGMAQLMAERIPTLLRPANHSGDPANTHPAINNPEYPLVPLDVDESDTLDSNVGHSQLPANIMANAHTDVQDEPGTTPTSSQNNIKSHRQSRARHSNVSAKRSGDRVSKRTRRRAREEPDPAMPNRMRAMLMDADRPRYKYGNRARRFYDLNKHFEPAVKFEKELDSSLIMSPNDRNNRLQPSPGSLHAHGTFDTPPFNLDSATHTAESRIRSQRVIHQEAKNEATAGVLETHDGGIAESVKVNYDSDRDEEDRHELSQTSIHPSTAFNTSDDVDAHEHDEITLQNVSQSADLSSDVPQFVPDLVSQDMVVPGTDHKISTVKNEATYESRLDNNSLDSDLESNHDLDEDAASIVTMSKPTATIEEESSPPAALNLPPLVVTKARFGPSDRRFSLRHLASVEAAAKTQREAEDKLMAQQLEHERLQATKRREEENAKREAERARAAKLEKEDRERRGHRPAPTMPLITPLSAEWEARVDRAMASGQNRELASLRSGTINRRSLGTLLPQPGTGDSSSGWLNDDIIDGSLGQVIDYAKGLATEIRGQTPKYHAFTSFFYKKLAEDGPESVKRWASRAKVNGSRLMDVDCVFIPVNPGAHWTLLVVWPSKRIVEYFDSLRGRSEPYLSNAKEWLRYELGASFKEEEWKFRTGLSPMQNNSRDCGVFTITTAKMLMLGWDPERAYGAAHIPVQRRRIAAELLHGGLTGEFTPVAPEM